MSRKFAFIAATLLTVTMGAGFAQAQSQSDMIPPGSRPPAPGMTTGNTAGMAGNTGVTRVGPAGATRAMPPRRGDRRAMRAERRAPAAAGANAAYMGGGAVYERQADGSLRPVM